MYQQNMGADEEIALLTLVAAKRVAADHVFALGLAVAGDGDGLYLVLLSPPVKLGARQQGIAKNINVGEGGQQLVQVALEVGQVIPGQAPD